MKCRQCQRALAPSSKAHWTHQEQLHAPETCSRCTRNGEPAEGDWILQDGRAGGYYRCRRCGAGAYGIKAPRIVQTRTDAGVGYMRNGFFCSLRCGFDWAVAEMGRRSS